MMKTLLSASALALLIATPAAAQQMDRNAPAAAKPATTDTSRPAATETRSDVRTDTKAQADTKAQVVQPPGTIDADKLIGRNIKNPDGDTIGEVSSVLIGRDGKIEAVIVGVGGFLGIGERKVAIDWDDLQVRDNGQTVVASMTKDQLKALPEFRYAEDVDRERDRAARTADTRTAPAPAVGTTAPAGAPATRTMTETRPATTAPAAGATTTAATTGTTTGKSMNLGEMSAQEIIGKNVVNAKGDTVGEIEDIVIDNNKAVHAIVSVGGFLGMGDKDVAVPFDELRMGQGNAVLMSEASEDQLKQMPAWKKDDNKWHSVDRDKPVSGR